MARQQGLARGRPLPNAVAEQAPYGKRLNMVAAILKKRFTNLTVMETIAIASEILDALDAYVVEGTA